MDNWSLNNFYSIYHQKTGANSSSRCKRNYACQHLSHVLSLD